MSQAGPAEVASGPKPAMALGTKPPLLLTDELS